MEFDQTNLIYILRLLLAGFLGALIGLERETRAKGAGVRTHFLVALGSALMMLVSQLAGGDSSRIAAQVVSGIGFIGAGTIMMNKQAIRGLTTAAGLWAVAGIGLAVGCGMYVVSCACTVLVLVCLELLQFLTRNIKTHNIHFVFVTTDHDDLIEVSNLLNQHDYKIIGYSVDPNHKGTGAMKVNFQLREQAHHDDENHLIGLMAPFKNLTIEKVER